MGFGSIIAAMVSVSAILLASYVCSRGGFYMADVLSDSFVEMQENKNEMLKTEIEIIGATTDGVDILLSVNNTGAVKIGDFEYMDVIVLYCNSSNTTKTVWAPYQEETAPLAGNHWKVHSISPDLINPGIFDAGEIMEMQVRLNASDPIGNNSENWIQVTTPNGAGDSVYFKR
ncbi:hypothetical protein MSMTP_2275 [Methanosarcina sp. MTP4]|uniref:hypothetical protein n=1 Tax=Methanosarcina sp. MTP4 TaxID=1434100 RepID=UPI0006155CEE|nr:hypothetical protein [Methanosarcina sp. MTP4]AKB25744.1 hypothetical protein MSMTP_2275 [Methanosarcina sp. MTP4]